eukprot:m.170411 g.170411  ORF g.170411 m.170411 type:complete len:82 (-) comp14530_c1_seq1:515-760(-)
MTETYKGTPTVGAAFSAMTVEDFGIIAAGGAITAGIAFNLGNSQGRKAMGWAGMFIGTTGAFSMMLAKKTRQLAVEMQASQ